MSKTTLATGTSPFAHLLSGFRGKRAEEDKPEDDEARKARRAEEDERREEEDARRAEEDDRRREEDARRAEEDGTSDEEGDGTDKPDGKKAEDDEQDPEADDGDEDATKAEDDMDDDEKKAFRQGLALGRVRENARASRIFASPAAAARPDLAATLAFTTRNSSAAALRIIGAAGTSAPARARFVGGSLDERMANRTEARPGADGGKSKPSFGDRVAAAVKKSGAR